MEKITFTAEVSFSAPDKPVKIEEIKVAPLTFVTMCNLWTLARSAVMKPEVALQRERILYQTHFMASGKRVTPNPDDLTRLPASVAKSIIAALDLGQGTPGKVISDSDDGEKPVLYKLGDPIKMKGGPSGNALISELEFHATTFGEMEEILASDTELSQTLALLRTLANPIEHASLQRLPLWAVDQLSVADGVTIMRTVLPNF